MGKYGIKLTANVQSLSSIISHYSITMYNNRKGQNWEHDSALTKYKAVKKHVPFFLMLLKLIGFVASKQRNVCLHPFSVTDSLWC